MNVVPPASSIGAPAAAVVPGAAAGAAPAAASFADLLRTLAGQEIGGLAGEATGASLIGPPTKSRAGLDVAPDDATAGDAAATGDAALPGALFGVPVAFALTVPPAIVQAPPASEGAAAGTDATGELPASDVRGAAADGTPGTAAGATPGGPFPIAPGAIAAATSAPAGPSAGADTDIAGAQALAQITDASDASVMAPPTTVPGAAAHVGAPAGRGPDSEAASPLATDGASRRAGRARQGRVDDDAAGSTGAGVAFADAQAATDAASATTPADATPSNAAATLTRLLGEPSRDMSRVPGLPRALARVLEQGAAGRVREHAAASADLSGAAPGAAIDAGALAALANAGGMNSGDGADGDEAPAAAAAAASARATTNPALAAALRAFQQAALPGETPAATAAHGADEPRQPLAAARLAAALGAAEPAAVTADGDRRAATMTTLLAPAFGAEAKTLSEFTSAIKAEATAPSLLSSADAEAVHSQVVQSLRMQWANGTGEATVRLRPEYLGDVTATIKVEQGAVTATLQADRPEVRRWMEANTQTLREGLVEHGLKLDRLDVLAESAKGGATGDERQGKPRGRQPQQHQPPPRPRRERTDADAPAFAVNP